MIRDLFKFHRKLREFEGMILHAAIALTFIKNYDIIKEKQGDFYGKDRRNSGPS